MADLPEIPDEAMTALAAALPCRWEPRKADHPVNRSCRYEGLCFDQASRAAYAAWPHLYAAALRHAREVMSGTDDIGGPEDLGYAAALRDLRLLADEATRG